MVRSMAAPPEDVCFITSTHMASQLSAIPAARDSRALHVCGTQIYTQAKYHTNNIH